MKTEEILNTGYNRILKIDPMYSPPITKGQRDIFIEKLVAACLGEPRAIYVRYDEESLKAILVLGFHDYLTYGSHKKNHPINRAFPMMFQGEVQSYPITEVLLKVKGDERIILYECPVPKYEDTTKKEEFLNIVKEYVKEFYPEEEAEFYEDIEQDQLSLVVTLRKKL